MQILSNLAILSAALIASGSAAAVLEKRTTIAYGYASADCTGDITFLSTDGAGPRCEAKPVNARSVAVTPAAVGFQAVKFYRDQLCVSQAVIFKNSNLPNGMECFTYNGLDNDRINGVKWS